MNIYVRMRGGLGNQMFQYAYALALRENYPEADILLDTREYIRYTRRSFALTDFRLDERVELHEDGRLPGDAACGIYHVYQRIYREFTGHGPHALSDFLTRQGLVLGGTYSPLPRTPLPENTFLYGYFQSAEPLLPLREKLCSSFSLLPGNTASLSSLLPAADGALAISIRLGSDISSSGWALCQPKYYQAAAEHVFSLHGRAPILVFSDAPERIRTENWFGELGVPVFYTQGLTPAQQIELMHACRDFVISNSTFAWWGSFLGAFGKDSIVIAPKIWQENQPMEDTPLVFPGMTVL